MGSVTLIVKATRLCNLRCSYCHDWRDGPNQTMKFQTISRLIASTLSDVSHNFVNFIWHGGEPTMLPIHYYRKVLLIQSKFQRPNQHIRNNVQSNGTHLSKDWIRFFYSNNFGLGISLDGPPDIHDKYRKYESGRPSFQDVKDGIALLKEYNMPFSVIMVIDQDALRTSPEKIFDFFIKAGINNFGFLAATPNNYPDASPGTRVDHYVDPKSMTEFLIKIYDLWKEHNNPDIHIREIYGIIQHLKGNQIHCTLKGGCLGKYYMIDPNGDISHCDLFIGDSRYKFGNIYDTTFRDIRNSDELGKLIVDNNNELDKMKDCKEFNICNGWCPHERYLSIRHDSHYTPNCCGLHDLISYMRKDYQNLTM